MSYYLNTPFSTQTLFLNSRNCTTRQTPDGNNRFSYYLSQSIRTPINAKLLLTFQDAVIPNYIETIRDYNNQLSFLLIDTNGNNTKVRLDIEVGFYDVYSFKDYINFKWKQLGVDITCLYYEKQFKYHFISSKKIYIINETNYPTTCGNIIGLGKTASNDIVFPISYSTPLYTIKMPSFVNFSGTPYIFLNIEGLTINNLDSNGNIDGTLVRIPVNCNRGEMIFYKPTELTSFIVHRNTIQSIEFIIEDHNNRPINIGSLDFQITLKIDHYYLPEIKELDEGTIQHTLNLQAIKRDTAKEMKIEEGLGV